MTNSERERWLEKYVEGFMFHDIKVCIDGGANFAAALTLSVYTEALGGLITGKLTESDKLVGRENYVTFLRWMGYEDDERNKSYYYRIRSGVAHQYFIKKDNVIYGHTTSQPRGIYEYLGVLYFFTRNYFEEFKRAYHIYKNRLAEDSTLQANLDGILESVTLPQSVKIDYDDSLTSTAPQASNISGDIFIFIPTPENPQTSKQNPPSN